MVIKKIEFLSDVKEKSIEKFTVYMEATMFKDVLGSDGRADEVMALVNANK